MEFAPLHVEPLGMDEEGRRGLRLVFTLLGQEEDIRVDWDLWEAYEGAYKSQNVGQTEDVSDRFGASWSEAIFDMLCMEGLDSTYQWIGDVIARAYGID